MNEKLMNLINSGMLEARPDIVSKYNEKVEKLKNLESKYKEACANIEKEYADVTNAYSIMEAVRDGILTKLEAKE